MTSSVIKLPFYRSLRFRLSLVIAGVMFCAVMATAMFAAANSFERELTLKRDLLLGAASAYSAALSDTVADQDRGQVQAMLRGVRDLSGFIQADVRGAEGNILAEFGTGAVLLGRDNSMADMTAHDLWRAPQLRVEVPIVKGGLVVGQLGLLADISDVRRAILDGFMATAIGALVAIMLSVAFGQFLISRVTKPLRQLSIMMSEFADDRAAIMPVVEAGRDETGVLATAFNAMIMTIKDRDTRIDQHLEALEDTVAERTTDLSLARDEAQAANAAKSDFLASMSHEIRTPMNGMLVMAEMLASADLSTRHRRYAEIISRSGNNLLTIINDILDLSKVEAGKLDLELCPTSLDELASDVTTLFWERAREKRIEIATYVGQNVPLKILADPTRLNQIISNLVNNALKFTETGGVEIRICAVPAKVSNKVGLVIEVEDTGIGIAQDKLHSIFEAFSQAEQSTTRNFGGTGLGLAVCQRLVQAMNGNISVDSTLGQGSLFRVVLEAEVSEPAPTCVDEGLKVQIDIDDGVIHGALERGLADMGCILVETHGDLLLTNSQNFKGSSVQTLPTVLLSDIGDTQVGKLLRENLVEDLLPNPFSRMDLAALVERARANTFRGVSALQGARRAVEHPVFDGLHVLAADDNAVNREVLREALAALNVTVDFAEDGASAVQMAADNHYGAIFMDGSMPVMDGFQATQLIRLREREAGQDRTTIIALTAQVSDAVADIWEAAGADSFMAKPFTLDRLATSLTDLKPHSLVPSAIEDDGVSTSDIFDEETIGGLVALSSSSGRDLQGRVWDMFKLKAPDGVFELRNALDTEVSLTEVSRLAHALKSMALSSGACRFAAACGALERQAIEQKKPGDLLRAYGAVDISLTLTLEAMDQRSTKAA